MLKIILPAAVAVALAAAVAGCNNSSSAEPNKQAGTDVKATVDEWSVDVSSAKAPPGKVTFDVRNTGKVEHEFVVLRTDRPAGALGRGTRVGESGNVGEAGDIAPGASKSVTLDLRPGHYALVCNLPDHYKLGMHTDLTVG